MSRLGKYVLVLALVWSAGSISRGSSPATKPATQPATKPSDAKKTTPAKDNVIYKCDSLGFQFQLPKSVKVDTVNSTPTRFQFDLKEPKKRSASQDGPNNSPGNKPSKDFLTVENIRIIGGAPCHGEATLDAQVANMRDQKGHGGGPKVLKDEPSTLAGIPAERFTMEVTTHFTRTGGSSGSNAPQTVDVKTRQEHLVAVKDGLLYDLCLDCDPRTFDGRLKLFNRAVDSFEWIEKPAPADQKK